MERHIDEFYSAFSDDTPSGNFHAVLAIHDDPKISFEEAKEKVPDLCKGWYELARLPQQDRLEFLCNYWLSNLPYHPRLKDFLVRFFNELDDIGLFLLQKKFRDPFKAELVYSCKKGEVFYRGLLGASEKNINQLQLEFQGFIFPKDYLSFLKIHNGFSKTTDTTGLFPSTKMKEFYLNFQEMLKGREILTTTSEKNLEPKSLIPFYESFGMPFYQCFLNDWYPGEEMGNVYYSGLTNTTSDINAPLGSEDMSFVTFLDWLMFYLEPIE